MKMLCKDLLTDYKKNSFRSFIILLFYRLMNYCYNHRHIGIRIIVLRIIKEVVFFIFRIDAQVSYKATIGSNIKLPHSGMGLVISSKAIIKNNQTIYHQVTIGINENLPIEKQKIIINENCLLSVGCKVISCEIGKNSKIGPNAVVHKSIPMNTLIVSNSIIKIKNKE